MESWGRDQLEPGTDMFTAQQDVRDFFYRTAIPRYLGEHLCLRRVPMAAMRLAMGGRVPEELGHFLREYPNAGAFPYFKALPIGFSWAFHLAHQAQGDQRGRTW